MKGREQRVEAGRAVSLSQPDRYGKRGHRAAATMSYMRANSSRSQLQDVSSIVQACSSNIQMISQNSGQIQNLLHQLGTRQETSELQERLQQLQHNTNQLAKETNRHLKELGSLPPPVSTSEQKQQKLQKERLMSDFSAALNNFQVLQRRAAEKEKESVARARAGSRVMGDGGNVDDQLVTFEKEDEWAQTQTEEPAITEEDLEIIKERETNIKQLEADILDVNQIFKDLARGGPAAEGILLSEEIPQEDVHAGHGGVARAHHPHHHHLAGHQMRGEAPPSDTVG
ncbi:hypothetical protein INR49_002613 [Caranx melampygus]|nr:hypothetical protein INR49_002613 [Caranx melampygus]